MLLFIIMENNYSLKNLEEQQAILIDILLKSHPIKVILDETYKLNLNNWYLGAGCISQTVWNYLTGQKLEDKISDYDLVYFNNADISAETQTLVQNKVNKLFIDLNIQIEAVNEARVHLWYEKYYGKSIKPYITTEDAISSWPSTATCVGITKQDSSYNVFAPYGLHDLFDMIVKPNKIMVSEEGYNAKCKKWKAKWPSLKVLTWNQS